MKTIKRILSLLLHFYDEKMNGVIRSRKYQHRNVMKENRTLNKKNMKD